jgi:acyl-CoA thioester hydrolase
LFPGRPLLEIHSLKEAEMNEYSKPYEIRWSDIDANGHVNYAAYIDAAGDLRYHFFTEHKFPPGRFEQLGIGPIYTALHAQFFREVRMGETVTITFTLVGLSPQGDRWNVHHDVLKSNGKKAVSINLEGTLLDLSTRKPALPVPELLQTFNMIPRAPDFEILADIRWKN